MAIDLNAAADPGELRAAIARAKLPCYLVAAKARINPVKLSRILNGHVRITNEAATGILRAIEQLEASDAW